MAQPILEAQHLVKSFGTFRAVDDVSFSVKRGAVVGLLGPNGAGKTTTIHMLLGITLHTSGIIKYFGKDITQHREYCLQRINFSSAYNTLQGRITVWENLYVFALLYGIKNPKKKILELIEFFEAEDILHERFWNLSAGQRARINLVKSLINDPELILMDEPTSSLDPDIADKTLSFIEELRKKKGVSILYTSHNMDEVERICDSVIFLDHGKIVAEDTPLGLTKRIGGVKLQLTVEGSIKKLEDVIRGHGFTTTRIRTSTLQIATTESAIVDVLLLAKQNNIAIIDVDIIKPSLEDVFLSIARKK